MLTRTPRNSSHQHSCIRTWGQCVTRAEKGRITSYSQDCSLDMVWQVTAPTHRALIAPSTETCEPRKEEHGHICPGDLGDTANMVLHSKSWMTLKASDKCDCILRYKPAGAHRRLCGRSPSHISWLRCSLKTHGLFISCVQCG